MCRFNTCTFEFVSIIDIEYYMYLPFLVATGLLTVWMSRFIVLGNVMILGMLWTWHFGTVKANITICWIEIWETSILTATIRTHISWELTQTRQYGNTHILLTMTNLALSVAIISHKVSFFCPLVAQVIKQYCITVPWEKGLMINLDS